MRLLLHDMITTAAYVHPLVDGWLPFPDGILAEPRQALVAADLERGDAALIPSPELAALLETHVVVPGVGVCLHERGAIAMRTPVRPDEVERTPIRVYEASSTAEGLARAVLEPFYGIVPMSFSADNADSQAVILEGAEALRPAEGGFTEDLVRAWFILFGMPVVSHVLVVPVGTALDDVAAIAGLFAAAAAEGQERRRDVRKALSERHGIPREILTDSLQSVRYGLADEDRRALIALLQKGHHGAIAETYVWTIPFAE